MMAHEVAHHVRKNPVRLGTVKSLRLVFLFQPPFFWPSDQWSKTMMREGNFRLLPVLTALVLSLAVVACAGESEADADATGESSMAAQTGEHAEGGEGAEAGGEESGEHAGGREGGGGGRRGGW